MKIEYKIKSLPTQGEKKNFPFTLYGDLRIYFNNTLYYEEIESFIAEMAISLQDWVKIVEKKGGQDFWFQSLEYEDGPTLAFKYDSKERYFISSLLEEYEHKDPVEEQELLEAVKKFLSAFSIELENKCGIILEEYEN